jgi:hypothetical protein
MKKPNISIFGILKLALALGIIIPMGCATTTETPPVNTPTKVTYTNGTTYTYTYNARDTSDKVDNTVATDTITSTVIDTNQTYLGMSNVTILLNTHSTAGTAPDTTFIAQDTASFWHYNYGLESLNNNPKILNIIGSPIQMGWVLQAKFTASPGDAWTAANNNNLKINVPGLGQVSATVVISAVTESDTTISVNGASVSAKHVFQTVTLTALGQPLVTTADTYVATSVGVTINIVHTAHINITGLYTGPVNGSQTVMVKHS